MVSLFMEKDTIDGCKGRDTINLHELDYSGLLGHNPYIYIYILVFIF
jgi:hypothetical protein